MIPFNLVYLEIKSFKIFIHYLIGQGLNCYNIRLSINTIKSERHFIVRVGAKTGLAVRLTENKHQNCFNVTGPFLGPVGKSYVVVLEMPI